MRCMKTNIDQLSRQIEQVVQEHLAASRRVATDAVARAFGAARGILRCPAMAPRGTSPRRASADIEALGERFYRAVCKRPGETMAVLAAELGSSPQELNRPMTQLKRQGRMRSVGQRQFTRYFPLTKS